MDTLGLSREHPGLRMVRTLVVLVHPTAVLPFPLLLGGYAFLLQAVLEGLTNQTRVG